MLRSRYPQAINTMLCMDNLIAGTEYNNFNGVEDIIQEYTNFMYSFRYKEKKPPEVDNTLVLGKL